MAEFYDQLRGYYNNVGAALRGNMDAARVFDNPSDKGSTREDHFIDFLKQHVPSGCDVMRGGYLFGLDGAKSGQLDVLVTGDTTPSFNFMNRSGSGKSFAPVDGCIAVVSVKSTLSILELTKSLRELSKIPDKQREIPKTLPNLVYSEYVDWPYKAVYAAKGAKLEVILSALQSFYDENPNIPLHKRPNLIHVGNQYVILRITGRQGSDFKPDDGVVDLGDWGATTENVDILGFASLLHHVQENAAGSRHILIDYRIMMNRLMAFD